MTAHRKHRRQYEELYADDPFVSPEQYGRLMQEADELDQADARNAELSEYWSDRAAEEEGEPA